MEQSIFRLIQGAVNEEGVLPDSFVLPDEEPEQKLKFALGAELSAYLQSAQVRENVLSALRQDEVREDICQKMEKILKNEIESENGGL